MYELTQVGPRTYYIDCPAKIGIYTPDGQHVYLIDSGNDKDAGRKVRQVLDRQHWTLTAILNTHSNADHIGGNQYWQSLTGCQIFANGIERAMTCHPVLEPAFLYGGYPCKDLRHKFLMAQPSNALDMNDPSFPKEIEVIPLPGHFFDMVGFRTPDNVVFLADCVSSEATLSKYGIPFIYDVEAYLQTLDRISSLEASLFVPAHAEPTQDIRPLATYNRVKVLAVADHLLEICRSPVPFDDALQEMFSRYELTMNFEQYVLVGSTIRSYFSWLMDAGRVSASFSDNHLRWQATHS